MLVDNIAHITLDDLEKEIALENPVLSMKHVLLRYSSRIHWYSYSEKLYT